MKLTKNNLTLVILALILSLIIGFVNYEYISVKNKPLTFTSSVTLYMPSKYQENTFILSTLEPKQWSSLNLLNPDPNLDTISTDKNNQFNLKYNPDLSIFLRNYFNTSPVINNIHLAIGKILNVNEALPPLYSSFSIGNGFLLVEANLSNIDQVAKFQLAVEKEYKELLTKINDQYKDADKINYVQPKFSSITNLAVNTKSIIQFISGFLVSFFFLLYIILFKNNYEKNNILVRN